MEKTEEQKKVTLIQAWEDWDDAGSPKENSEGPKLCKIDNPDCEACQ